MNLLFDENLSSGLAQALEREYPGSAHVHALDLKGATDAAIWERAQKDGYMIVSKDNDFRQLSFLYGWPPKVIWLSVANAGTGEILQFLRSQHAEIQSFGNDAEASLLVLTLPESP